MSILQGVDELRPGILEIGDCDHAGNPSGELQPAIAKTHDGPGE
jgi:hypothetical protein